MSEAHGLFCANKNTLKSLGKVVIFTMFLGILIHGFCYANLNLSHDSIYEMKGIDTDVLFLRGRFVSPFLFSINSLALPWFNGVVSLFITGIALFIIFSALNIHSPVIRGLVIGIILTDRTYISITSTYIHDLVCYSIALLFVALAVWIFCNPQKKRWIAAILIILSLGIYQSYIQIVVILLCAKLISDLINNKDFGAVLKRTFISAGYLAGSMVVYYVIYKIIVTVWHFTDSVPGWTNYPSNAFMSSVSNLIERILSAIAFEAEYAIHYCGDRSYFGFFLLIVSIAITLLMLLVLCDHFQTAKGSIILIFALILLLPIETGFIMILADMAHDIMYCSFAFVSLWGACIAQKYLDSDMPKYRKMKKYLLYIACITASVLILTNALFANRVYVKKDLEERATLTVMTRIIDRIEQTDGYTTGSTPVVFYGDLNSSPLMKRSDSFDYLGVGLDNSFSVTYKETYRVYINEYMNYPMIIQDTFDFKYQQSIEKMPVFPAEGSTRVIDGILFVKLSEY